MGKIITFGEIMLRISPKLKSERILQAKDFIIEPGGSESNVATSLSQLGNDVFFITKLPKNDLSEIILRYLKSYKVETKYISYYGSKIGIYWTEKGNGPRPSKVIYDREFSSFYNIKYSDFKWNLIFNDIEWFHTSGITPALSKNSYLVLKEILKKIDKKIKISIDLNYRKKLWNWLNKDKIKNIMSDICSNATLILGNYNDFQQCLGLKGSYDKIAKDCFSKYDNLKYIAINLRDSKNASENILSSLLFIKINNKIKKIQGKRYYLKNVIDRIGTGDSFASGIIHGIINYKKDYKKIVNFANSLFILNHTIRGDTSQFKEEDIIQFLKTNGSGRIIR